jgi:hypothetical protein
MPRPRRPSLIPPGPLQPQRLSGPGPAAVPQELSTPLWAATALLVGGSLFFGALVYGLYTGNRNVLGALLVVPPLTVIVAFIARRLADFDRDDTVVALVMGAFAFKMIAMAVRYAVAYDAYGGAIDATIYHRSGAQFAKELRVLDFDLDLRGRLVGTNFVRIITAVFYAVSPSTLLTGFLLFSFVAFLGTILYWRAFKTALPDANHHKYALLVFLLPSMVFWPASIGKDAWMSFVLGLCALGAARLLTRGLAAAAIPLALGLAGVSMVRPHIGILVLNGLVLGALLNAGRGRSPLRLVVILGVVFVIGVSVMARTREFFGVQSLNRESVEEILDDTEGRTATGGSEYDPVRVRTPADLPAAAVTVLYRPFLFEARSPQIRASAVEGLLLIGITIASWPSLRLLPRGMRKYPYLGYCIGTILTFVIAFSAFSNFGLLARQRTQILPLFLALLCLAPRKTDALAELDDAA